VPIPVTKPLFQHRSFSSCLDSVMISTSQPSDTSYVADIYTYTVKICCMLHTFPLFTVDYCVFKSLHCSDTLSWVA